MRTVEAGGNVALEPQAALALWTDTARWSDFVEGFARAIRLDPGWPAVGAAVVWESGPDGRGRVTERVVEHEIGERLATDVSEAPVGGGGERLRGRQTLAVWPAPGDDGEKALAHARLSLDYELVRSGVGSPGVRTDLLFVRRALRESLARTLARFAATAARESAR